jgi:hypothetical protein
VLAAGGFAVSARAQSASLPELKLGVDGYNSGEFSTAHDHFQRSSISPSAWVTALPAQRRL